MLGKRVFSAGTHLVVAGIGAWLAWSDIPASSSSRGDELQDSLRRRHAPRPEAGASAALLARAAERAKRPEVDPAAIEAAGDAFPDPDAAKRLLQAVVARESQPTEAEIAGAVLRLFRADPAAALSLAALLDWSPGADAGLDAALKALDAAALLELVAAHELPVRSQEKLLVAAAPRIAALPPEEAAALWRRVMQGGDATDDRLASVLLRAWPRDQLEGLLDLVVALDRPDWLGQAFQALPPREAHRLLLAAQRAEDLPADFRHQLGGLHPGLAAHLFRYADPSVPLEERIGQMGPLYDDDLSPEQVREIALKQISTVDINELMKNGTDYRFAFRHGTMSAEEVLAAVKREFPELAAASDFETRVRVFNELAAEDPAAAAVLLEGLSKEERALAVLHQARWTFRDIAPDAFLGMIGLAADFDSPQATADRLDAWRNFNSHAYPRYGDDYLDWVRALPPGPDRTAARAALADQLSRSNEPELAQEFQQTD